MHTERHAAFFLVGPTAVGKTAVAHALARAQGAALLSADSMLVYRGMDIGTAKPTAAERGTIPYGGLDLVSPDEPFSTGQYVTHARAFVAQTVRSGRPLIVAGGTGLYVKALTGGLIEAPPPDPVRRAELEHVLAAGGVEALRERLRARDPVRLAALADPENPRRLIRAIELAEQGIPAPARGSDAAKPRLVGLRMTPADLLRRIALRVARMFDQGLLEEVQGLRAAYPAWSGTARHAIGYAEALTVLEARCSVKVAMEHIAIRTRQLARRQMTWFRHQADVTWVDLPFDAPAAETAARVQSLWNEHGRTDLAY